MPYKRGMLLDAARCTVRLKRDGTRAETRFLLSSKRTSPFKSAGASVQSTAGSRGVRISVSNVGYTSFRGSVSVLATHSTRQFPLHFPSSASPCAIKFQTHSTVVNQNQCRFSNSVLPSIQCSPLTSHYDLTYRFFRRQPDVIARYRLKPKKKVSISM